MEKRSVSFADTTSYITGVSSEKGLQIPEPDYNSSESVNKVSQKMLHHHETGFDGMNQPPPPPPGGNTLYPRVSIGFEDVNQPTSSVAPPSTSYHENEGFELGEKSQTPTKLFQVTAGTDEKSALVRNSSAFGDVQPSPDSSRDVKVDMTDMADPDETPDNNTLTLRDGVSSIDYILAYTDVADQAKNDKRLEFQKCMKEEGLIVEVEDKKFSQDGQTYFCKIHLPWKLALERAEMLKIKMPIQANDIDEPLSAQCCKPCGPCRPNVEEEEDFFTAPFYKDGQFINYGGPQKENPDFFSPAQRGRMVYELLARCRYGDQREQFGVKRLVKQGVYTAAYPLHSGPYKSTTMGVDRISNKRQELYYEWAKPSAFMKEQPYDAIRHYFGEKVAIYFSWLGFYTWMLLPASIVGITVFIYGLASLPFDKPSEDICKADNITMCPLCDQRCGYWNLSDSCRYSKATYVVDNPATIFFAIFMALWATFFIEFWKRHQARIQYDWDVADYEELEQNIRPEFEATASGKRKNPITQDYEPHIRSVERCIRVSSSLVFILFLICVVLAAILAVIIYRIVIVVLIYEGDNEVLRKQARLITSITAACISVLIITLLNKLYEKIAIVLTNMETWKFQNEWEDAFTFKMYVFQFVNYYGTIIYIAFFKGRFVGTPRIYNVLFGFRVEECDPAGCLIELAIQLAIVMVGKQALNNFKEIIIPVLIRCIKKRKGKQKIETDDDKYTSWERDYDLVDFPIHGLYEEYLEMVIQYGFVTLFVAAFPLAPFFALLNNIIEVRLDAMKLTTQWKRPMADRAQDIGTWFFILKAVSKLAVLVNACIIAFTSDFIQKSIHKYTGVKQDYMDWSLSTFRTSDFDSASMPNNETELKTFGNLDRDQHFCRYRDFREGPGSDYALTATYWHVLTAKLAFVILFEHIVLLITAIINFLIPDVPGDVKDRTLREKHLVKVSMMERIKNENQVRHRSNGSMGSIQNATSL